MSASNLNSQVKVSSKVSLQGVIASHAAGLFILSLPVVVLFVVCAILFHLSPVQDDLARRLYMWLMIASGAVIALVFAVLGLGRKSVLPDESERPQSELRLKTDIGSAVLLGMNANDLRRERTIDLVRQVLLGPEVIPDPDGVLDKDGNGTIRRLSKEESVQLGLKDNQNARSILVEHVGRLLPDTSPEQTQSIVQANSDPPATSTGNSSAQSPEQP